MTSDQSTDRDIPYLLKDVIKRLDRLEDIQLAIENVDKTLETITTALDSLVRAVEESSKE